jgi:hypothetical protein
MIRQFSFESAATAAQLPWLDGDRQLAPGLPGRTRESIETAMRKGTQAEGKITSRAALDAVFRQFRFFRWLTVAEPSEKIGRNEGLSAATVPRETNC